MTEKIFPTMKMEELFSVEVVQSALRNDSSFTTHPMTYEDDQQLTEELFDDVAYSKCSYMLRN